MEKLNIAELLRDCPTGMELDCTMFDNVTLVGVNIEHAFSIEIKVGCDTKYLTKEGCYHLLDCIPNAKCVIFPKGKTTWEGFQRPFKDGDIIYVCDEYSDGTFTYVAILKQIEKGEKIQSHCFYNFENDYFSTHDFLDDGYSTRFATEEEKEKLFKAIKDNGYKWNPETKTLEKMIEPKFKVGDRIKDKYVHKDDCAAEYTIRKICTKCYKTDCGSIPFENQDNFVLITTKFDVTKLKPFDKVLVRERIGGRWHQSFFGYHTEGGQWFGDFVTFDDKQWVQCIPYEGNEHLVNTSDDCSSFYETWE